MKTSKTEQYVKITSKGKVSITLSKGLCALLNQLLTIVLNDMAFFKRSDLNTMNSDKKILYSLISEVYMRHYMVFNMAEKGKIILSLSQAYALWRISQSYQEEFYMDAEMGGILMQLHQKLS